MVRKERVFYNDGYMVYELGGDFFHCSFFLDHTDLKKLKPGTDEMINAVLRLGQAKAQELNMV